MNVCGLAIQPICCAVLTAATMQNLLRTLTESHTQVALPPAELTLLLNAAKEARVSSEWHNARAAP